jgi:hypothetical protein
VLTLALFVARLHFGASSLVLVVGRVCLCVRLVSRLAARIWLSRACISKLPVFVLLVGRLCLCMRARIACCCLQCCLMRLHSEAPNFRWCSRSHVLPECSCGVLPLALTVERPHCEVPTFRYRCNLRVHISCTQCAASHHTCLY